MVELLICAAIGYFLGCINPAWFLAKWKKADLRSNGTRNLGATNTFLILGKKLGLLVLCIDIAKACLAVKLAVIIIPEADFVGLVAGIFAILGHMFPFYIKFRGGKGLACLGGIVLGLSWEWFLPLLFLGLLLAYVTNYACSVAFSASLLFPVIYGLQANSLIGFALLTMASVFIIAKHRENITRIRNKSEMSFRDFFVEYFNIKRA